MRPATEALWCRLSQSQHPQQQLHQHQQHPQLHQPLLDAASESGFLPLHLSQRCLVRQRPNDDADGVGRLLGALSVFGCLADGRCPDSGGGGDLACRELALVRAGAGKSGLNGLLGAVMQAENVGRPVCLVVVVTAAAAALRLRPRDIVLGMREAWPKGSRCCYRPVVFLLTAAAGGDTGGWLSARRLEMTDAATMEGLEEESAEQAGAATAVLIAFEAASSAVKMATRGS